MSRIMEFIDEFNKRKDVPEHEMELLKMEERAMDDVFRNIEAVGYSAGAILIDKKIEAIAIGGRLGGKMVVEHVEKANVEYRGLYQITTYYAALGELEFVYAETVAYADGI